MARKTTKKNTVIDNPKLKWRKLSDGSMSAYLEYYIGYEYYYDEDGNKRLDEQGNPLVKPLRRKESLKLAIPKNPATPTERNRRDEMIMLAEEIRRNREKEFKENTKGYKFEKDRVGFLAFFQKYIDEYTKKDKRMILMARNRFADFLSSNKKYKMFSSELSPESVDRKMILAFVDYLRDNSSGSGAQSVFQRFKKVVSAAVEDGVFKKNPCAGISIPTDETALIKDVLSSDEIQQLISTHYDNESKELRRAFIFTLFSGIRYCDLVELTYKNVDYQNRILHFEQSKTKHDSPHSHVDFPLNDFTLGLIGEPPCGNLGAKIFPLPTHESCNKSLKRWCKRAGITKHITWHCGRHTFATNILENGASIKTVADLLGHSGLKYTERYVRAVDERKKAAVNSLPMPDMDI